MRGCILRRVLSDWMRTKVTSQEVGFLFQTTPFFFSLVGQHETASADTRTWSARLRRQPRGSLMNKQNGTKQAAGAPMERVKRF